MLVLTELLWLFKLVVVKAPPREELFSLNAPAEILPLLLAWLMLNVDLVLFNSGTKTAFVLLPL